MPSGVYIDWNRDELENLYWEKQLSCREIADMKGIDNSAVSNAMTRLGIKKRTPSEVHKLLFVKGKVPAPPHFKGDRHPRWKGGRRKTRAGYIYLLRPKHPRATKASHGYVFEHIIVWEKTHGEPVPKGYHIHHLNGVRDDNRPENLVAVANFKHPPFTFQRLLQERIRELEAELDLLKKEGEFRVRKS